MLKFIYDKQILRGFYTKCDCLFETAKYHTCAKDWLHINDGLKRVHDSLRFPIVALKQKMGNNLKCFQWVGYKLHLIRWMIFALNLSCWLCNVFRERNHAFGYTSLFVLTHIYVLLREREWSNYNKCVFKPVF